MRIDIERNADGTGAIVQVHEGQGDPGVVDVYYEGILRYRAEDRPDRAPEGAVRHSFRSDDEELDALLELNEADLEAGEAD